MDDGQPANDSRTLKVSLKLAQFIVASLTIAGALVTAGALAQHYLVGQKTLEASLCVAKYNTDAAEWQIKAENAYTRYVKSKSEWLLLHNRLAMLKAGIVFPAPAKEDRPLTPQLKGKLLTKLSSKENACEQLNEREFCT